MRRAKYFTAVSMIIAIAVFFQTGIFAEQNDYFEYEMTDTVKITAYKGSETSVTVPEEINGLKVTEIGDFAFDKKAGITSLILPQSLQKIGECAFRACRGLTTIEIPSGVTSIGFYAFDLCEDLTILCYRGSAAHDYALRYNMKFSLLDAEGVEAEFEYTTNASAATLTRYIGTGGDVEIPTTLGGRPVMTIAAGAFANCRSVTSVTFTETVTSIEAGAFAGCENLEWFSVHEYNRFFSVKDGILYNYDQTEIISYAHGRADTEYTVPVPITKIGNSAFRGAKNLKKISFYGGIESVGHYAFADCVNLETVSFENLPTYFGADVFKNTLWQNSLGQGLIYFGDVLCGKNGQISGEISVKEGTKVIAAYAFYDTDISSVKIPESVRFICDRAFYNTSSLAEMEIAAEEILFGEEIVSSVPIIKCIADTPVFDYFTKNGNITEPLTPQKPKVRAVYISDSIIYIEWDEISKTQEYKIYLNGEGTDTVTNSFYTYKNLKPQTLYTVAVSSVSKETEGPLSDSLIIITATHMSGDVDNNMSIDITDAMMVFRHVAGKQFLENEDTGDINSDKKVNITDAMVIFRIVAGKIDLS